MKKRIINTLLFLLAGWGACAQSFTHSLALPKVDSTAYYQIELPLEIYSVCNNKRSDIRIYEAGTNTETAYKISMGSDYDYRYTEVDVPVIFEVSKKQKNRYQIFIPPFAGIDLNELTFKHKNFNKNNYWPTAFVYYTENFPKNTREGEESEVDIYNITDTSFALRQGHIVNGNATRIVFEGVDNNFEITGIAYKKKVENSALVNKINIEWEANNNGAKKITTVSGKMPFSLPILKMEIEVDSTGYYNRRGNLMVYNEKPGGLFSRHDKGSFSLEFANKAPLAIDVDNIVANRFLITINNKDNKPLPIKSVSVYAPKLFVVTRLEAKKEYILMTGNPDLKTPQYDWDYNLMEPKNRIIATGASLQLLNENNSQKPLLVWGTIGLCLLVMGGMAFSMIKKSTENQLHEK